MPAPESPESILESTPEFPLESSAPCTLIGADAVARGVARMFARHRIAVQREVALRNNRRADLMGVSAKGDVILVEIKCSKADLLGDQKWPDYLDYCDKYYWAVPPSLDAALLDGEAFLPERSGVIIADGYGAEILRPAARFPLAPARRKLEVQRLAILAMRRLSAVYDPGLGGAADFADWEIG
jgi:hypothetical protein